MSSIVYTSLYQAEYHLVLRSLHAIGWVHRDISAGNVLIYDGPPRTIKLADFEYAKRTGESTGGNHEIRTVSTRCRPRRQLNMLLIRFAGDRGFHVRRGQHDGVPVPA